MLRRALEDGLVLWCLSERLFAEYVDVVARPRVQKCFSPEVRSNLEELLEKVREICRWPEEDLQILPVVEEDADDDVVVATAVACGATIIVSGDDHLLALGSYQGIRIMTPRDAVEELFGSSLLQ